MEPPPLRRAPARQCKRAPNSLQTAHCRRGPSLPALIAEALQTLTRFETLCCPSGCVPTVVAEILDSRRLTPDLTDEEGNTLLHIASANGHDRVVWCLIERGADVNSYNFYRWTALIQAAAYGHTAVISILLEAGALVDATNVLGASALACAARGGHMKVVAALLGAGAPITTSDGTVTPLMMAAFAGHESVCQLLVDRGAPVDTVVRDTGWTALMFAAHNGFVAVALCSPESLLASEASVVASSVARWRFRCRTHLLKYSWATPCRAPPCGLAIGIYRLSKCL